MENFDVSRLDGHSLRLFVSLCETCSVSQTADLFDLNQSTVSYTLDKLRAAVGDPLFVRSGRGITPTEKALAIHPRVQEILASLEGLASSENYNPAQDTRPVVVAIASPSLITQIRIIHRNLHTAAPNARLEIRRLASRERLLELLESGETDLAIAFADEAYPVALNHCAYGSDDLAVFYDPTIRGPVETFEDYTAARHAVAGFGDSSPSAVERRLKAAGVERTIALVSPTASMLGDLILGTDIVATMPRALAAEVYHGLAHCAPPLDLPQVKYNLVWHRRYDHSGRNQWLRELVLNSFALPGPTDPAT